jgi:hypothetical protein
MTRYVLFACGLVAALAAPAGAQQLKLQIGNGRVTLDAQGVTARQILAEWARVGGTKVVGGDKVPGGPLTLHMVDMPERQALDIVLRSAAGFMAAPRQVTSVAGASTYDRILILATSSATRDAGGAGARPGVPQPGNGNSAMMGRPFPPRPPNMPPPPQQQIEADEPEEQAEPDEADTGATQPVFTFPAPAAGQNGNPVFVPVPNNSPAFAAPGTPGGVTTPVITLQPGANGQPTIYNFVPNQDGAPTAAPPRAPGTTTTFGAIGSSTPGMIQPVTPAPGQVAPAPQRPPGQR